MLKEGPVKPCADDQNPNSTFLRHNSPWENVTVCVTALINKTKNKPKSYIKYKTQEFQTTRKKFRIQIRATNDCLVIFLCHFVQIFTANTDRDTVVYHTLISLPSKIRYIRVVPWTWHNHITMRMELYGCPGSSISMY